MITLIDLRSDTVTRPTPDMLAAMMAAPTGDDVFGEDPTVAALEQKAADMFGREAALFCPSGTMCNQIAIKIQTRPLEQIIAHEFSHIQNYELGGHGFHSGCTLRLIRENRGLIRPENIEQNINPDYDWLPVSRMVWIENTSNKSGGNYYQLAELQAIHQTCQKHGLKLHLDGARLFNALVETGITPFQIGELFNTISICLSKGLGAPVGSLLIGDKKDMRVARRVRKVMGGGMRQAGILAAAGIYALDHNISRLKEDHRRAKALEQILSAQDYVDFVWPADTNILMFGLKEELPVAQFLTHLNTYGIKAISLGRQQVRMVTHLDFTDEMLARTTQALERCVPVAS